MSHDTYVIPAINYKTSTVFSLFYFNLSPEKLRNKNLQKNN